MKIYLASRFSRRDEMIGYARQLQSIGHMVDARWLFGNHSIPEAVMARLPAADERTRLFAEEDYADVRNADLMIFFPESPENAATSGGRHVEFGLALAWGKRVLVVGPPENIFHNLPPVERFVMWEECFQALKKAGYGI